ncbi:MAG: alpha/beta hydrolase [Scytolyngbya sp. HA4215-MV1]|jgi:pimeloyl-ACP methyl ester carboxylesterase|nr:alpha/beta hydrolase [Scytolyngbya sp. HA4215-MV1]
MPLPFRNSRIKLSQGQIFWREVGQGGAIVFLHGSWDDGSQWVPVMEQLGRHYHCFAPDLLGFGDSERAETHYSIALEAECLSEYLESLKLRRIYLVGYSIGGWIAASYALKHPERLQGLILLSPEGGKVEGLKHRWLRLRWRVRFSSWWRGYLKLVRPIARWLGAVKQIDRALQAQQQLQRSLTACKLLFQRRWAEIKAERLHEQLDWLRIPVLILHGEDLLSESLAKAYALQVPLAELRSLPYAGDNLPQDLPDEVAQSIREFIHMSQASGT